MNRNGFRLLVLASALAGFAGAQTNSIVLTPSSVVAGSPSFTLTVTGGPFVSASSCAAPVVIWVVGTSEVPLATSVIPGSALVTATVPASLVATAQSVTVKVRTQYQGTATAYLQCISSDSPSAPFLIGVAPVSISASCNNPPVAQAGQQYYHTLAATGGTPPYIWTVKNIAPQVTLSSTGVISGVFQASDAPLVSFTAVVRDSLSLNEYRTTQISCQIQVQAQVLPVISNYFPTEATACGPDFTLNLTGSNFIPGARIGIGGPDVYSPVTTTFLSNSSVTGSVTRDQIATPGGVNIVVGNPAATNAGYLFSDPRPFNIRRTPTVQTITPARAAVGSADLAMTLTGADFVPSVTRVLWQSGTTTETIIPTQTSTTQMSVTVPRRLLAVVGRAVVRVVNFDSANSSGVPYSDNCSPPQNFTIDPAALTVVDSQLPPGRVGVDYNATITASGGVPPYSSFSLLTGSVPGLSLAVGGVLSGRPTQAGVFSLRVQVTDSSTPRQTAQRDFSLRVDAAALQIAAPATLPDAVMGTDYLATFTTSGGVSPYRWSLAQGSSAVPGLTLNSDGSLTGQPTQTGSFTLRVQVTDSSSPQQSAQRDFPLRVNAPALAIATPTAAALPPATLGSNYSATFTASGGTGPYRWDLQSGSVAGLALSPAGVLSGTPTASGNFTLTVRVTDAASVPATRAYTLTVGLAQAGLSLTVPTPPASPTDQPTLALLVTTAYPVALEGRLSLAFTPNAAGLPATGYLDPAVKFASGGTTLSFTVPANATTVTLPGNGGLQTGTVAGTITVTLDQLRVAGTTTDVPLAGSPATTIAVARTAPAIVAGSVAITGLSPSGFAVEFDAYSTPRDLRAAVFNFAPTSGARLDGTASITVQLATESAGWFSGADGLNNGSRFHLRVPFTLSGNSVALGTVSVTLENSVGTSAAVSGGIR